MAYDPSLGKTSGDFRIIFFLREAREAHLILFLREAQEKK